MHRAATAAQVARIAGHLINSLTAREAALAAGNTAAAQVAEQDAAQFAAIAWRAIHRAGQPRAIAQPAIRTRRRGNDINLFRDRFCDHPALADGRSWPYRPL